jgi:hypothetical protein
MPLQLLKNESQTSPAFLCALCALCVKAFEFRAAGKILKAFNTEGTEEKTRKAERW